jgi:heme/copper-type cytochrome/quinol oxidase subunit 4
MDSGRSGCSHARLAPTDRIKLFTVVVLISLPTVMYGGFALLGPLSKEKLNEFQRTYFRAGHAHAGVLLVMTLATLAVLDGTEFGGGARWVVCLLLALGVIAQSGGMFLHLATGKPGAWSNANSLTTAGAGALVVGMRMTAYGVIIT